MTSYSYNPPINDKLDIVYNDDNLLVVNKPSGLLSVPGRGKDKSDCLISRVQEKFPDALIVHRLDMSTSGLVLLAIGKDIERSLSILFQKRKVEKKYIAVVNGKIEPGYGEIDLPIMTDWPNRPKQKVDYETGKKSITKYKLISFNHASNKSRVELLPLTGRTHQLRIHMKSIGHAILGDELYANKETVKQAERLLLHACYLSFQHPVTGKNIEVISEPDF